MKARSMFLIVFICLALVPTFVAAEDKEPGEAQNAISVDLLWPIFSCVHVLGGGAEKMIPVGIMYQRVISDHFVLFVMGGFWYTIDTGWDLWVYSTVEVDWHPFHKGFNGFYVGLSGDFWYDYNENSSSRVTGFGYLYRTDLGLALGWQFLLPAHIIIDLALGIFSYGYEADVDVYGVETSGFAIGYPILTPRTTLSLGFRF